MSRDTLVDPLPPSLVCNLVTLWWNCRVPSSPIRVSRIIIWIAFYTSFQGWVQIGDTFRKGRLFFLLFAWHPYPKKCSNLLYILSLYWTSWQTWRSKAQFFSHKINLRSNSTIELFSLNLSLESLIHFLGAVFQSRH